MSLKTEIDQILNQSLQVAYRPPEGALTMAASPIDIFQLVGGPAYVTAFFAYADVATAAASTLQVTACGVNLEDAAVACNLLIGEMAVWPLFDVATAVIIPNVASTPCPTIETAILGMGGIMISENSAGGDLFELTVGNADTVGAMSFFVVYYKMRPETLIIPLP